MKKNCFKRIIIVAVSLLITIMIAGYVFIKSGSIEYAYQDMIIDNNIDLIYQEGISVEISAYYKFALIDKKVEIKPVYDFDINKLNLGNENVLTISSSYYFKTDKKDISINLIDDQAPVIELVTNDSYYIYKNEIYIEEGYKATDNYDGDLTDKVVKSDIVDGKITYSVSDSYGNTTSIERTIKYKVDTSPTISVNENYLTIELGNDYSIPGYSAYDSVDGNLTNNVVVTNNIDNNKVGQYYIKYQVKDSYGNVKTTTIDVYVYQKQKDGISEKDVTSKIIYLTYDDGPSQYTSTLLKTFEKYNVKATFFVTGNRSDYRYNFLDAYNNGHSIGLHTFTHSYKTIYSSTEAFWDDLKQIDDVVYDLIGIHPSFFRFAGGASNTVSKNYCKGIMSTLTSQSSEKGYQYYDWNVDSKDAGGASSSTEVFKNVTSACSKKDISFSLQHDTKSFSVNAVDRIVAWGLANGYTFLPITESTTKVCHHPTAN